MISMGDVQYNPNIKSERIVYGKKETGSTDKIHINTGEWVKGWYDHLGDRPVYIESKKQLAEVCNQRGLYARSIMKPKSRGKGFDNKWRRT